MLERAKWKATDEQFDLVIEVFCEKQQDNFKFLQNPYMHFCRTGMAWIRKQKQIQQNIKKTNPTATPIDESTDENYQKYRNWIDKEKSKDQLMIDEPDFIEMFDLIKDEYPIDAFKKIKAVVMKLSLGGLRSTKKMNIQILERLKIKRCTQS